MKKVKKLMKKVKKVIKKVKNINKKIKENRNIIIRQNRFNFNYRKIKK